MIEALEPYAELETLLAAALDERLTDADRSRLEQLLAESEAAREYYVEHVVLHAMLRWEHAPTLGEIPVASPQREEGERGRVGEGVTFRFDLSPSPCLPISSPPSLSLSSFLPTTPLDNVAFSYAMSAVLVAVGLFIFSLMSASSPCDAVVKNRAVPRNQALPNLPAPVQEPEVVSIGRITGMVDCTWPNTDYAPFHDRVVLGAKFMLASGLMEITYKTGAKVILQGPCTYTAESAASGYLSLGKLTARVESRSRLPDGASRSRLPSGILPTDCDASKSRPAGGNYFVVRTPTAVVTDLGTEFGVEVDKSGDTESHVFRGKVAIVAMGDDGKPRGNELMLKANQSARVEKRGDAVKSWGYVLRIETTIATTKEFVRCMPYSSEGRKNSSRAYSDFVLSLKPAAYYRMERSVDGNPLRIFDSTPGGNHGLLGFDGSINKDAEYALGRFGKALFFRGPMVRDYAIVPDYPKATANRLSVSVWVSVAYRQSESSVIAANWGNEATGQFYLSLYGSDGDITACVTQHNGKRIEIREGAEHCVPMTEWVHVAFVADGTELRLYHNGKEAASTACDGVLPNPPMRSMGIGCRTNNTGTAISSTMPCYWLGRIDELAVFNRALSLEEIHRLYEGIGDKELKAN